MTSRKDEQFFASLSKGAESGPPAPEKPPKWLASKCPTDPEFCLRAWKAVFLKRPNIDNWPQAVSIWKSYVANPAKVEEIEKSFAGVPKPQAPVAPAGYTPAEAVAWQAGWLAGNSSK